MSVSLNYFQRFPILLWTGPDVSAVFCGFMMLFSVLCSVVKSYYQRPERIGKYRGKDSMKDIPNLYKKSLQDKRNDRNEKYR